MVQLGQEQVLELEQQGLEEQQGLRQQEQEQAQLGQQLVPLVQEELLVLGVLQGLQAQSLEQLA